MKRHKCGLKSVAWQHPLKLVGFTDAAFKTQPEELTYLAFPGFVATLRGGSSSNNQPMSFSGKADLVVHTVRRQRRAVRTFST